MKERRGEGGMEGEERREGGEKTRREGGREGGRMKERRRESGRKGEEGRERRKDEKGGSM